MEKKEKFNKNGFLIRKGYEISYKNTQEQWSEIPMFIGDTPDETAIVFDDECYILNGDHRENYLKCKTFKSCMEYFKKNKKLKSSWSN